VRITKLPSVAVVGGGIFGTSAAITFARAGNPVDLYEEASDILTCASSINQYRLHSGYHYPRSAATGQQSRQAFASFYREFGSAVLTSGQRNYAISRNESKTSAIDFVQFCKEEGLYLHQVSRSSIFTDEVEAVFEVDEKRLDIALLKRNIWAKLRQLSVQVILNKRADADHLQNYDYVVIACYASNNSILSMLGETCPHEQFEICEKPVVQMPESFYLRSVVVMDGPFMCTDPIGNSNLHVWGNVVHGIHASNIGPVAEISAEMREMLNRGIIRNPSRTNFESFRRSGSRFMPDFLNSRHIGSMFTVKTVRAHAEATDERLTEVKRVNDRVFVIRSGKIANSIAAAQEVLASIENG
jgi:hypothetical protein